MLILTAQAGINLSSAHLRAGNVALYSPNSIILTNSMIFSLYVFCTDSFSATTTNTTLKTSKDNRKLPSASLGNSPVITIGLTPTGESYY
jgi:hypothetical protein